MLAGLDVPVALVQEGLPEQPIDAATLNALRHYLRTLAWWYVMTTLVLFLLMANQIVLVFVVDQLRRDLAADDEDFVSMLRGQATALGNLYWSVVPLLKNLSARV
jgi:hypothetical protein